MTEPARYARPARSARPSPRPRRRWRLAALGAAVTLVPGGALAEGAEVTVGSKLFTESVILGEIARLAAPPAVTATHRRELGGSRVLFAALERGEIDLYPEYTGTLRLELLAGELGAPQAAVTAGGSGPSGPGDAATHGARAELPRLRAALAARGLAMTAPLGFDNSYGLAMGPGRADERAIRTISDLATHPDLAFGFSNEFMDRADGWPALRARYGLPQARVNGLSHELAYRALAGGDIDVADVYTTDPQIGQYDLQVLVDDRAFFPRYEAVFLYRDDLRDRAPRYLATIEGLAGRLDQATMIAMNRRVQVDGATETAVAAAFLGRSASTSGTGRWQRLVRRTGEHLTLVAASLGAAIVVAIPLGIAAAQRPALGQLLLGATGILQTVPSLALFVFLIPFFGIGAAPAIAALFVYSLLPIVRNTHAGLVGIAPELKDAAAALALPPGLRLRRIELPLAAGSILAGIKTAAVINVGTATLGALIGAGGLGQPILTGIRLDDLGLILEGAVPAALLALATQVLFDALERRLAPAA